MANCSDVNRHKFQCLTVPVGIEKFENRKGLDDPDCNLMVPTTREATLTPAIRLQQGMTFGDSTFGIANTNIVSVGVKHLDINSNSDETQTPLCI